MDSDNLNLQLLIEGCRSKNRHSQRKLYEHFYGYGMSVALRYSESREEALEIVNDSFLKVFNRLDQYDPAFPFKVWFRKILINSSIDYFRKFHKHPKVLEITEIGDLKDTNSTLFDISPEDNMLPVVQKLPPAYRIVFNLYVMEEYKHHEIAEMLDISVGTSKSNLARAKVKLRELLIKKRSNPSKQVKNG
jgi:RNA polymerase sigma-70 factor (ECF subfamily)